MCVHAIPDEPVMRQLVAVIVVAMVISAVSVMVTSTMPVDRTRISRILVIGRVVMRIDLIGWVVVDGSVTAIDGRVMDVAMTVRVGIPIGVSDHAH